MANGCLREYVRVLGKADRNGKRHLVPVATLYACCIEDEILVGFAKLHTGKDKDDKEFGEAVAVDRAYALRTRLKDYGLRIDKTGWNFVNLDDLDPDTGLPKERAFPFLIQKVLPAFLVRCEKYFKQGKLVGWASLVRQAMVGK